MREEGTAGRENALECVWQALNRDATPDSLTTLLQSLNPVTNLEASNIAFGFDTNALYRLGVGSKGDDTLDYLSTRHPGPIVIPGQVIQEVWNNQMAAVKPLAKSLHMKVKELEAEAARLNISFGGQGERVREAVDELTKHHAEMFNADALEAFRKTLELLSDHGTIHYVPRTRFHSLAKARDDTRTPPGFIDSGFGDFFLWADFLYGIACLESKDLEAFVLVTNDRKPDWSRNGITHPLLQAEARLVRDLPFQLWTTEILNIYVHRQVEADR